MKTLLSTPYENQPQASSENQTSSNLENESKMTVMPKERKSLAERFALYEGPLELSEEWDFDPVGNEFNG